MFFRVQETKKENLLLQNWEDVPSSLFRLAQYTSQKIR